MSRLSKEREAEIRQTIEEYSGPEDSRVERERDWLDTIDVHRAERDEAIVGAYRAAADRAQEMWEDCNCEARTCIHQLHKSGVSRAILALTPQSALDAVERRERELIDEALEMVLEHNNAVYERGVRANWPTAADVLAKVKRA